MTAFDYKNTAKMPFGLLLKEIVAMEARGLGTVSASALDDAITIQRDLIVMELLRTALETGGTEGALVKEDKKTKLLALPVDRMIAPPGRALERFRREYLVTPDADLSALLEQATAIQNDNAVPKRVPLIGTIYCSAQTGLGRDGGAIINYQGLNGGLVIQACCRAIISPLDRERLSLVRINENDPKPLQEAQTLLNTLIDERRSFSFTEGEKIGRWISIGAGWLNDAGFGSYAYTVKSFAADTTAPFKLI
ncbi:MAG: hypothetical protein KGQ41_09400 [Alphaproteobacteria bacterium]|nr:hypothetical protein [Alphaproteobacteria bacterium]